MSFGLVLAIGCSVLSFALLSMFLLPFIIQEDPVRVPRAGSREAADSFGHVSPGSAWRLKHIIGMRFLNIQMMCKL